MKKWIVFLGFLIVVLLAANFMFFKHEKSVTGAVIAEEGDYIEIKGSDTLLQMASNLAEAYSEKNKGIKISVTGGGSGTGIASLLNGEVQIADSSRGIKDKEIEQGKDLGFDIIEVKVARDMLSVITNEDNKVSQLTKEQIGAIYRGDIVNWKEVGGEDLEITLYGRQSTSGTYIFFLEEVVLGEYSQKMRNLEGNQAILEAVKQDKTGIGYAGAGYLFDEDKNLVDKINVVEVSNGEGYVSPLDKDKISEYPLSRLLYQYLSNKPDKNTEVYDFLMFELSDEGQDIVEESGFFALSETDVRDNKLVLA